LLCVKEVRRVLKPKGQIFVSFIPYLSGAIGVASRMYLAPDQVSPETLRRVFNTGVFNNNTDRGFQEAYHPTSNELASLFGDNGFSKMLMRSIRGWGYNREEQILKLRDEEPEKFEVVMELISKTASDPSIVEMCSHAIYIGRKQ